MGANVWFWLIFVICILFHGYGEFGPNADAGRWGWHRSLVFFVLIGLLGWGISGSPLK